MALALNKSVMTEVFGPSEGTALRVKQALMVVFGIVLLAVMATRCWLTLIRKKPRCCGWLAVAELQTQLQGCRNSPRNPTLTLRCTFSRTRM